MKLKPLQSDSAENTVYPSGVNFLNASPNKAYEKRFHSYKYYDLLQVLFVISVIIILVFPTRNMYFWHRLFKKIQSFWIWKELLIP